ncbi:adhesion G-protein coupled receptor G4 [Ctenodactylus gundi]
MKEHIIRQRLYGVVLVSSFIFLSDTLSLRGKKLDFYGRGDAYVRLTDPIPELSRFTACIDVVSMGDNSSYWMAFSFINNTSVGTEGIDLGLAGDHQQLILYNWGKIFSIRYHLTPFQWHTLCLTWDGVKGRLELFLNKERIVVIMDRPHSLPPNGTLVLGHFPKNGVDQIQKLVSRFTISLYYFQLWDHILENEEFMKCLDGNVVSWEEDVWLLNIIPTVDRGLRCFVSENMTIQEMSTTVSQQIESTPSQATGLKPQKTAQTTALMSESMPVFAAISHASTVSPPSETKLFGTSVGGAAPSATGFLSTSGAINLSTQNISVHNATDSMKVTKSLSPESTRTTKMEAMATETFHPATTTDFLSMPGFIKDSVAPQTSVVESQSTSMKTTSSLSTTESTSMSTTSWPKHKLTDTAAFPISTSGQEFLVSTAAETVPWSIVEGASAESIGIGTTSAFTSECLLSSTAAQTDSLFPRNQTTSALATTDMEITFTAHSMTPIETLPALQTEETKLTSKNLQDASSPHMEDIKYTFMPEETSSMVSFPETFTPITGAQSIQTVIDTERIYTTLTPGITLAPTVTETMLSPTIIGPVDTQNTLADGDYMFPLISTESASTSEAFESGSTSITDETAHWFSTDDTTWTSRPGQTLLTSVNTTTILTFVPNENFTSVLHGDPTDPEHSSTTTNLITPLEASIESKATTSAAGTTTSQITLSKLTSPCFANFSTTSVSNHPEFKLTTLLKTIPMSSVAANELPSTPGETVVPPIDRVSTLDAIKLNFSTEESTSETTQTEKDGTSTFGDTATSAPKSATTERFNATVTKEETTSHHLKGKSTIAAVAEVSLFSTVLEVTDESAQTVTDSDVEKLTTLLDNETATAEVEGSWLSTKSMKTTRKHESSGTAEIFNSTHTYTVHWTLGTPEEDSALSPTPESTPAFSEPRYTSTSRTSEHSTDRAVMALSGSILPPRAASTHFSATSMPVTHMLSLPVNVSPVPSRIVPDKSKPSTLAKDFSTSMPSDVSTQSSATRTIGLVPPLSQTASMTSDTLLTQRDSVYTISEATVTPMAISSHTETLVPSLIAPTPVTKTKAILPSTLTDRVTPSTHTPVCSKPPPGVVPVVSSTHVISTISTPVTTQPVSQMEETSTYALSFPYTFSGSGDVSLATDSTVSSVVKEITSSHSFANKLTTSVDIHVSQSSTHLVNIPVSTQLVTGSSTLSSEKQQVTISMGKSPETMEVTKMSPSKNSYSQHTSSFKMTNTGFSETTKISHHQTHSPSETPLGTSSDRNSASSPTSRSSQATPTLASSSTADVDISETPRSHEKTALPSQALTRTPFLYSEKESTSTFSIDTLETVEIIVNSSSVTHPVSHHQDTSFVDTPTSRATRMPNSELINTRLSQLSSLQAQPEMTSVASFTSDNINTFPKSLSPSTTGLSNANFTTSSADGITPALSVPNTSTTPRKASVTMSIPISQMSLPVDVTASISKKVSDTPAILRTESSETAHPGCWKSPSMATSRPMPETASLPVNDSIFSPAAVSPDTSTTVGSFSALLSSVPPMNTTTTRSSTLDVTPVTYTGITSKSTLGPSASTVEVREVSIRTHRLPPPSVSFSTKPTFLSTKTIPTMSMAETATSVLDTTDFSLLSSKNTEATSFIPKTTFSPLLSETLQSLPGDEATALDLLPGTAKLYLSTVDSDRATTLTNAKTGVSETVLSSTLSDNHLTSLNIHTSPSLTNLKSTIEPVENIKATTTYLSSNIGKVTSLSKNTSLTAELAERTTFATPPALNPSPGTPSSEAMSSLTSPLYSPYGIETKLSTPEVSPISQVIGVPGLGTRITSSNTQSLHMISWNTPRSEDPKFPLSTSTHTPTPIKMEAETLHLFLESLPTTVATQTSLVSRDSMPTSSILTSGGFPTFKLSESPSLSTSLRATPTSWADIKHTLEKTTTSARPRTTLPLNPSGTSPMLTWVFSGLPSGSPLATVSNVPHVTTSSTVEVSKSTFLTSDMIPTYILTNSTMRPLATRSTVLTRISPKPTLESSTSGSPTSLPMPTKITGNSLYISTAPKVSSRTTVPSNSRTVPQPPVFSGMSISSSTTDHTLSIGSTFLPSPTKTSAWSRISAASASPTVTHPNPTPESLINTTPTASSPRTSFPFITTVATHPSTAIVSSVISSSFGMAWLDSTSSLLAAEPFTSSIAVESLVSFYNIEMNFLVFDEESGGPFTSVINEFVKNWLNSIFHGSEFSLANLAVQIKHRDMTKEELALYRHILEQTEGQGMATISHVPYSCVSQVIMKAISPLPPVELISRIRNKIHGNFKHGKFTQDQLTLLVMSDHVVVKKLEPGKCKADETPSKYKGTYKWLLTNPTEIAQARCIKNEDGNATRICSINIQTGKSQWGKPRLKQCKLLQGLPDKIVDLAHITISDENADDVAEHILNLINDSPLLDEEETRIIVSKVAEISKCDEISMNLTQVVLQIISSVSEKQNDSTSNLYQVSNEILRIIELVGHKMQFAGKAANLTVARMAMAVLRVGHNFEGMAFNIRSYEEGTAPEIYLDTVPLGRVLASIYLPKSLRDRLPLNNLQTILFNFFGQTSLFKTKNMTKALTTYVVSASVSDVSIQSLVDPVVIRLQHIEGNQNYYQVHCAFWDFETNNGLGGWNSSGCKVKETNTNYTICQCDHLTHFGVLMDFSRSAVDAVNERILVIITYTGCGISSVFLGIAMVTYIAFYKLRKDYPSKILINLCTALLMLNLAFLSNSWLSSFQNVGLCITAAVALHYFLLVSLTWMGLEAVHMYFALVKVFNMYIPNYILKFCLVGWGIPAVTVAVILSVSKDLYGTLSPTTLFCWIKDDSTFYVSVVAYFCLIFLVNLSMFCTVLAQLNSIKSQSQKTRWKRILRDLKGIISLTFLLGLTWGFAFFAWGPLRIFFLYFFSICNTLQGFLIFVFYCVMKETVREQWQTHLLCGWLRLDNSFDGSSRGGVNFGYKQERLKKTFEHKLLTPSLKSTATSSTFKSLASAQGTPSELSFPNGEEKGYLQLYSKHIELM